MLCKHYAKDMQRLCKSTQRLMQWKENLFVHPYIDIIHVFRGIHSLRAIENVTHFHRNGGKIERISLYHFCIKLAVL